ncbi:hypothetical protein DTO027I6_10325 [Penicillium roqueforti]|nr:hypothetical protein DTO027I6_10325 [Penicillium roqueforti]
MHFGNADVEGDKIHHDGRATTLGKYVVGIDYQRFTNTVDDPEVQKRILELESQYKNKTIIIGVDRMDYTKGLPEKMEGFRVFLNEHPECSDSVILVQIAIPSREDVKEYQDLDEELPPILHHCSTFTVQSPLQSSRRCTQCPTSALSLRAETA